MASVTLLTGGSVPKGLESHTKERKVIRITDIARKKNSMTNNEKLEKIKKLADDMYYAAANLGPNVGSGERLRKTMEEYHKFIIHEYNKEEPVSEDFETALEKKVREAQDWTYIEEEGGECPLYEEFGADDLEEFARWGAEWVRNNEKEPISKELTDEIKLWFKQWSENEMEWSREDIWDTAEHFANWQKQQMMKDAITGQLENGDDYLRIKCLSASCRPQDDGKLIKFIIIKED